MSVKTLQQLIFKNMNDENGFKSLKLNRKFDVLDIVSSSYIL